jgi:hypothetical protein
MWSPIRDAASAVVPSGSPSEAMMPAPSQNAACRRRRRSRSGTRRAVPRQTRVHQPRNGVRSVPEVHPSAPSLLARSWEEDVAPARTSACATCDDLRGSAGRRDRFVCPVVELERRIHVRLVRHQPGRRADRAADRPRGLDLHGPRAPQIGAHGPPPTARRPRSRARARASPSRGPAIGRRPCQLGVASANRGPSWLHPSMADDAQALGPTSRYFFSQRLKLHYVDWGSAGKPPLLWSTAAGTTVGAGTGSPRTSGVPSTSSRRTSVATGIRRGRSAARTR